MAEVQKAIWVLWSTASGTWSGSTWATNISGKFIMDALNLTRTADETEIRDGENDLAGLLYSGDRMEGSIEVILSSATSLATIQGVDTLPPPGTKITISAGADPDYNGTSFVITSATKNRSKGQVGKMTFNIKKSMTQDITADAAT